LNCTDLDYGVWLTGTCEGVEIVASQFIDCVFGLYAEGNDTSLQGTSTTSMTVGTGSQSFTTQTGLDYYANMPIQIYETANSANYMDGIVTSYNSSTGAMVVNVTSVGGSGTYSAWSIFPNHYISVINVSDGSLACLTCGLSFDWCAFVHVQDCEIQQRGLNYLYVDMQLISNNTVFFLHDNICTDYATPIVPSGIIIQGVSTNSCINVHDNIFRERANAIDFMSGANTNSYVHDNYGGAANDVTTTFQNGAGLSSTNYHNNI
ncbi:MAG: hypothetical protein KGI25_08060, partial [Thaumarchaeota archaeon]|nr:hypothetical protein [Nitrososphaerota archaeon]